MRRFLLALLVCATTWPLQAHCQKLTSSFEQNLGQYPDSVAFVASIGDHSLALMQDGGMITSTPSSWACRMRPLSSRKKDGVVTTSTALETKSAYFLGDIPDGWIPHVSHFERVTFEDVWDGIDVVYRLNSKGAKYEVLLDPHRDPDVVVLEIVGADEIFLDEAGRLHCRSHGFSVIHAAPYVYQIIDNDTRVIPSRYVIEGNCIRFDIGPHHPTVPLVIDPAIEFSTYLGGDAYDAARRLSVDIDGNIWVVGTTTSSNFGLPLPGLRRGGSDVFVAKLDSAGSRVLFNAIVGGKGTDVGLGIDIDERGRACITGATDSPDFPLEQPLQGALEGSRDAFICVLDSSGENLSFSTYLGGEGEDLGYGILVDRGDLMTVAGRTTSGAFPAEQTRFSRGTLDDASGFVTRIVPPRGARSRYWYSSRFGGSDEDWPVDLARFDQASVTIVGMTRSRDFPVTNGVFQDRLYGVSDAFALTLSYDLTRLNMGTYLGGERYEFGRACAIGPFGDIHLAGETGPARPVPRGERRDHGAGEYATGCEDELNFGKFDVNDADFPVTAGAFQTAYGGGARDAFVAKLDPQGRLHWATYLGGDACEQVNGIDVDGRETSYVTGITTSSAFPVRRPIQSTRQSPSGIPDAFITVLRPDASRLMFSTYLGGTSYDAGHGIVARSPRIEGEGPTEYPDIYVTGWTNSRDGFPTVEALQPDLGSARNPGRRDQPDAFVVRTAPVRCLTMPANLTDQPVSDMVLRRNDGQASWLSFRDPSAGNEVDRRDIGPAAQGMPYLLDLDGDGIHEYSEKIGANWIFRDANGRETGRLSIASDAFPAPADYDGDGRDEVVVYTGRYGSWDFFEFPSMRQVDQVTTSRDNSGEPVPMDYDGDGRCDLTVFHRYSGIWRFHERTGRLIQEIEVSYPKSRDIPCPADYDGDCVEEVGLYRQTGEWHFFDIRTGQQTHYYRTLVIGWGYGGWTWVRPDANARPAPLDLDGDRVVEPTLFHGDDWYIYQPNGSYDRHVPIGGFLDVNHIPLSRRGGY